MKINNVSINSYQRISSGQRINRASDDPAGLPISEKMISQKTQESMEIRNTKDEINLLRVADSSMNMIKDNLNRIRELSLQASNGIMTSSDKKIIQNEINQLLEGTDNIAKQSNYNGINLLDDKSLKSYGKDNIVYSIGNMTVEGLKLNDYDVTEKIEIDKIDKALKEVNFQQSKIGAEQNKKESQINSKENYEINIQKSISQIKDADVVAEKNNIEKNVILEQFKIGVQMKQQQAKGMYIDLLV